MDLESSNQNPLGKRTYPMAHWVKNLPAMLEIWEHGFDSRVRKIPWRRKWQPTPVVLPGKFHGQRSPEGHSS